MYVLSVAIRSYTHSLSNSVLQLTMVHCTYTYRDGLESHPVLLIEHDVLLQGNRCGCNIDPNVVQFTVCVPGAIGCQCLKCYNGILQKTKITSCAIFNYIMFFNVSYCFIIHTILTANTTTTNTFLKLTKAITRMHSVESQPPFSG